MIVSIDPSWVSGAIVMGREPNDVIPIKMMDNYSDLTDFFETLSVHIKEGIHIFIEDIPKTIGKRRPEARVYGLFTNMGACSAMSHHWTNNVYFVNPRAWQKDYHPLPKDYDDRKRALWEYAQEQFPNNHVYKYQADAYLIWKWGYNYLLEKTEG